jgi:hypothetical protein
MVFRHGVPLRVIDHVLYVAVASAIAQTLGAFLGLYFTAIGVIVASAYARVPTDVRALAIREHIGTRYLKIIALTCVLSVYLAALAAVHLMTSRSGFTILLLLTTYSVFAFVDLGLRVYQFLDTERLAQRLNGEVYLALQQLRVRAPFAKAVSFQAHHRGKIEEALSTYDSLFSLLTSSTPPNFDASKRLLLGEIVLWKAYVDLKSEIPALSDWYRSRPEYESLLASDVSSNITVHLATATMPQPRSTKDYLWFDRSVARTLARNLTLHLNQSDLLHSAEILGSLQFRIGEAAQALAVPDSILVERMVSEAVIAALPRIELGMPAQAEESIGMILQLCDFVAFAPMQILLGLATRLRSFDPKALLDVVDWPDWFRQRLYYKERLPSDIILRLEDITRQLSFEVNVEDAVLTAGWYLREAYVIAVIETIDTYLRSVIVRIEEAYLPVVKLLSDVHGGLPAMHIALRGLETCHKLRYNARDIAMWSDTMRTLHVYRRDIAADPDLDNLWKRLDSMETGLHEFVAGQAFKVYDTDAELKRALPDYFGQAYMMVAQETFTRLRQGGIGADAILRALFGISLLAIQRLGNELAAVDNLTVRLTYITEPLLNLLEVSGYAYLFSQLHASDGSWNTARTLWANALRDSYLNAATIRFIYDDDFTVLRPMQTLRFSWQKMFRDDLVGAATGNQWLSPFMSAVAKDIDSWHHFDLQGKDAFLLVYLRYQAGFTDMKLPHRAASLQHRLDQVNR